KEVAIKLLASKYRSNPAIVRRFVQEARSASRVRHRNIVEIYDCGTTDDGLPYFAMELLNGIDIRRLMKKTGPLPWTRALRFMKQICAALSAAHRAGVIHRDMKPGNCFVVEDGDEPDLIKVVDFGIAKVLDADDDQSLTQTGVVMGTAHYMSPEQARSESIDPRSDVYSAGIILFEMLTGRLPFEGSGFMGTLSKHLTEPIPSLFDAAGKLYIPPALAAVMDRVLAKDPSERYQNADEFAAALEEVERVPKGRAWSSMTRSMSQMRRRRGLWLALGAIGIAACSAGAAFLLLSGPKEEPPSAKVMVADAAVPDVPSEPEPEPEPASASESESESGTETESESETDEEVLVDDGGDDKQVAESPKTKKVRRPRKTKKAVVEEKPERLSGAVISKAVAGSISAVKACGKRGALPGTKIKIRIEISAGGKVKSASSQKPLAGTPPARCVEGVLKKVKFPAAKNGQTVTRSFSF
ncbi:MAG: protein kinase domain-containing protein, partial [Nannocystaceae bacterium]